jgi:hypothetical protein
MGMGTPLLTRLIAAGPDRKTRLHDADHQMISFSRLLRNGPRALSSAIVKWVFGKRPTLPWISYDAQQAIASLLHSGSRVLEFGSGMSTVWFASRSGQVVAIESDAAWALRVEELCSRRGLKNARVRLATAREEYVRLPEDIRNHKFDLVVIDGYWRTECLPAATEALSPDGAIYLDNADGYPEPLELLRDWALRTGREEIRFTDFSPTALFVTCGSLFVPSRTPGARDADQPREDQR